MINELIDMFDKDYNNKKSKWFDEDMREFAFNLRKKTDDDLEETYNRQKAIRKVTVKEANKHCQFGGLPKVK